MSEPIRPLLLADHARRLAERRSRRGRPLVTWLRRSVSASYYAVFHAISLAVADQVAPHARHEDRLRLTRSVQHGQLAEVCTWLTGEGGDGRRHVQALVRRLRGNRQLVDLAETVVRLQQARHQADYDHLTTVRAGEAFEHHAQALRALATLDRLRGTADGEAMLALVALHARLS